jgi:tyrosinase
VQIYRHIPVLELDYRSFTLSLSRVYDSDGYSDAPGFFESSFWKDSDPESGLGGWGDPNDDFSVLDGGFRTFQLSYPSPHHVRRNFTARPWEGQSSPFVTNPKKLGNTSFTASVIEAILKTAAGDFKSFQTVLEAFEVRSCT